ncbi:MAG: sulfite oxidase-like oxidoreductase [Chloroflexi bacterium]|nr:sulfite oxidase-like oxidoreductase [Chloroflexota bacterium]
MEAERIIKSPDTERKNRLPPGQHVTEKFPVLHYGDVPKIDTSRWTLRIFGLVEEAKTLSYEGFIAIPHVKVFSDIHCVTRWSRLNNLWEGISASAIRGLVDILPSAKFVMVHGVAGFTTNLSLDDFFQPDVLFALKHDNQTLTPEHGYPVRLVVPRLYFWKSAKWVTGLEFMAQDKPGFWESHGYHMRGDPWKEERYSE